MRRRLRFGREMNKTHKPRGAGNSRHEPKDSADFFPTPAWATRALIEHVFKPLNLYNPGNAVWEPACGAGHMVRPLLEYYEQVLATDISPQCQNSFTNDFLGPHELTSAWFHGEWVITNPPFNLFQQFFDRAMALAKVGVAFFAPLTIIETIDRYDKIYRPFAGKFCIAPFVERVPIIKNTVRKDAKTSRAYAWLIVMKNPTCALPPLHHIPPCRKQLERDEDYEDAP